MPYKNLEDKRQHQRAWMQDRRNSWIESMGGKCVKCCSDKELQMDHIDPEKKISHRIFSWSDERRIPELEKCQLLCKECHLLKTREQFLKPLVHGTNNAYKGFWKCRCQICRTWNASIVARQRSKKKKRELQEV